MLYIVPLKCFLFPTRRTTFAVFFIAKCDIMEFFYPLIFKKWSSFYFASYRYHSWKYCPRGREVLECNSFIAGSPGKPNTVFSCLLLALSTKIFNQCFKFHQQLSSAQRRFGPPNLKMMFVCGQCWRNGQLSEADKNKKYCSAKARHTWVLQSLEGINFGQEGNW